MLISNILKQYYVKLGGNIEDVEQYKKVAPILNEMLELIKPSSGEQYSYDEIECGTWVDGKTIYKKTYYLSSLTSGTNIIDSKATYIDTLVNTETILFSDTVGKFYSTASGYNGYSAGTKLIVEYDNDEHELSTVLGSALLNSYTKMYVTVKYTKK